MEWRNSKLGTGFHSNGRLLFWWLAVNICCEACFSQQNSGDIHIYISGKQAFTSAAGDEGQLCCWIYPQQRSTWKQIQTKYLTHIFHKYLNSCTICFANWTTMFQLLIAHNKEWINNRGCTCLITILSHPKENMLEPSILHFPPA